MRKLPRGSDDNDVFQTILPELVLAGAIIGPSANDAVERPFVTSLVRHLFKGLYLHQPDYRFPKLSEFHIAPRPNERFNKLLVIARADQVSALSLKMLEVSNATVALYWLDMKNTERLRYVSLCMRILTPDGTYLVEARQTDRMSAKLPDHFTNPAIGMLFHYFNGQEAKPMGIRWEKPAKPKKARTDATAPKTEHGVVNVELA